MSDPASEPVERVDLVNEADEVLGSKDRADLVDGVDRWRIAVLHVMSSDGQWVLLARRAAAKRHDPGRWAPLVAGTVSAGESYEETVVREAFEEAGLCCEIDRLDEVYRGPLDVPGQLRNAAVYAVTPAALGAHQAPDDLDADPPSETQYRRPVQSKPENAPAVREIHFRDTLSVDAAEIDQLAWFPLALLPDLMLVPVVASLGLMVGPLQAWSQRR